MKKAILVFIDGTTCDNRHRIPFMEMPEFFLAENIMKDIPTPGSVNVMEELAKDYILVYIGARPSEYNTITKKWFSANGFPEGEVFCGKNQTERMAIVKELKKRYNFYAGIGDRWDDNELHLELGAKSFILQEWTPNWDTVRKYINADNKSKIESRCGLLCSECSFRESHNCGGCVETNGNPFHGECHVAKCCHDKGFMHCGECPDIPKNCGETDCKKKDENGFTPCDTCDKTTYGKLHAYSYTDPDHGDNPPGARVQQCKKWVKENT